MPAPSAWACHTPLPLPDPVGHFKSITPPMGPPGLVPKG